MSSSNFLQSIETYSNVLKLRIEVARLRSRMSRVNRRSILAPQITAIAPRMTNTRTCIHMHTQYLNRTWLNGGPVLLSAAAMAGRCWANQTSLAREAYRTQVREVSSVPYIGHPGTHRLKSQKMTFKPHAVRDQLCNYLSTGPELP
jgi:hypothetical protein